jgi:hypothetical protein
MSYRRWVLLAGLTSAALVACPQPPAPAPIVTCANSPTFEPASSVTVTGMTTDASTRVVDAADISSVEANRLQVAETGGAFKAGELVVSECNEGLIRKISGIQPAVSGQQLSPLGIKKVYIQTENATLEDVMTGGTAAISFGDVDLDKAATTQALPGVQPQAVNGKIPISGVKIPLAGGSSITVNGFVQQTLDPKFNLVFANNALEKFEVSLKGDFAAELKATLETGGKLAFQAGAEQSVAQYKITRAFLVGVVPVVIVLEPKLIIGAKLGADDKVRITAGVTPTLKLNLGMSYDKTRNPKWKVDSTPVSFALNQSFNVTVPTQGNGAVYAKLQLGIKLYGIAGPLLEFKPYFDTDINPNSTAGFHAGISSSASLTAGFKVLGKGIEVAADLPQPKPVSKDFTCTLTQCS